MRREDVTGFVSAFHGYRATSVVRPWIQRQHRHSAVRCATELA